MCECSYHRGSRLHTENLRISLPRQCFFRRESHLQVSTYTPKASSTMNPSIERAQSRGHWAVTARIHFLFETSAIAENPAAQFKQLTRLWSRVPATQIEAAGHGLFWEAILREAYADRDYFNIDHHRGGFAYGVTAAGGRVPWSLAVPHWTSA
jgi:hypothetical protein